MYKAKKFPIQKWVGRYQSHLIYLYGTRKLRSASYGLEEFFEHYPTTKYCDEFAVTDVTAYKAFRIEEGCNLTTLDKELRSIRRFYTWLIDHCAYPHANPALAHSPLPTGVEKKSLTLEDVRRILGACDNPLTKDFILSLLTLTPRMHDRTWSWHTMKVKKAFKLCGLRGLPSKSFRRLLCEGVLADIARLNEKKLRDAFLSEAELDSYPFRDIQITPGDKRPPIGNKDLDDLSWFV